MPYEKLNPTLIATLEYGGAVGVQDQAPSDVQLEALGRVIDAVSDTDKDALFADSEEVRIILRLTTTETWVTTADQTDKTTTMDVRT